MARKRFVSPKFFAHGALYDAETSSGLPLRLGFQALWCQADRRGLFAWRPRELKLQCLPYDPVDFGAVLDALESHHFIKSYTVGGKKYGYIPTLVDHQSFHQQEKPDPTIPDPPPGAFDLAKEPAPPQPGASPVPTPPQPEASSTVAVTVAVTGTTTIPAASTIGDSAPCNSDGQPPGQSSPVLTLHAGDERPRPPVPLASVYLDDYASFCDKALVYQRAALDTLLKQSGVPDVVFGQINAIVKGQHTIRTAKGDSVDISHVLIALPEAVGKFFDGGGKKFDGALFAGCVRRVANRKPEPTPADQRASEEQLRRAHPQLVDDRPRTPEEQREGRERVRLAMHAFYLQAGNSERARAYETPERGEVAA